MGFAVGKLDEQSGRVASLLGLLRHIAGANAPSIKTGIMSSRA